jgi:hypothetical protein
MKINLILLLLQMKQNYNFACGFYGCETWSLTLRKEHRLRVFQNRMLRKICGPRKDGVKGGWRKLHREKPKPCRILMGKPEGERSLGRPRRRWENNIKMDFREIGWGGID